MVRSALVMVLALAACFDPSPNPVRGDARGDARGDSPFEPPLWDVHVDGSCGAGRYLTGQLADLESTTANFQGVGGARFDERGGTGSGTTAANGSFALCVAGGTGPIALDMTTDDAHLDGFVYLTGGAVSGSAYQQVRLRDVTGTGASAFYASHGLTYDESKAHVLVHAMFDSLGISIDRSHGMPQAGNDNYGSSELTWGPGEYGTYVLFPNVDAGAATATVTIDGSHTVPIAANKLTIVAYYVVFL